MKTLVVVIGLGLFGCKDPKFIRKEINLKETNIKWYYYSYITSSSADIIDVTDSSKTIEIFRSTDVVTNVTIDSNIIRIKLYEPYRGIIDTKPLPTQVFNYKIVFDTTSTYQEHSTIPRGKKEFTLFP